MKATIAVYNHHKDAVSAVQYLKEQGYSTKNLSILGKADKVQDEVILHNKNENNMMKIAGAEVGVGAALGTTLGVLTGVGLFAIPGLGFLFGAGALVGAIAGFDIGLIGGGVVSALTLGSLEGEDAKAYEKHLAEGKYLVIAQGNEDEVDRAKTMLEMHGMQQHINIH